jgi:hypothetical protein
VPAPPRNAPDFANLLERARTARQAHERAESEWHAVRDELRAVTEAGTLPRELRQEVGELLRDEGPAPPHRRWRPAPS